MANDYVKITFTDLDENTLEKVLQIERLLGELGITFDRGIGFGGRDWEWDWSLSGPVTVRAKTRPDQEVK